MESWKVRLEQKRCLIIDGNSLGGTEGIWENENPGAAKQARSKVLKSYGQILKKIIDGGFDGTLMITGGDTLMGCMGQLGVDEVEPLCELEPGIVLSQFTYREKTYRVISKSWGFGTETLLSQLAGKIVR